MFWATLWALVAGFTLSGAVQAFVSRDSMQRRLGDHRPATVVRASAYGAVSSSCSYAASALARSLVVRGADFLAAMVFMFASTNLVIELGIVLLVLIGWQFLAAQLIGGTVMIVLLVAFGGLWLRGRHVADALDRAGDAGGATPRDGSRDLEGGASGSEEHRRGILSLAGWSDAAGYTISDLTMLRREMVTGFVVAGYLTVVVPTSTWSALFVHGHGFWTSLENAAIGPLVAIISFVCSIGNVPLAAALWKAGISFGGVVAFIFADLITLPLLLVYRKQYGQRMALRMLAVFWVIMSSSGLITEYLLRGLAWIPSAAAGPVSGDTLRWGYTTILDAAALVVLAAIWWLHRHRDRFGGGVGYATDPVCEMQVRTADAPASTVQGGETVWFCSEQCKERFVATRSFDSGRRVEVQRARHPG